MDDQLSALMSPLGPPVVGITGPAGIGRTTRLATLGVELEADNVRIVSFRFTVDTSVLPARAPAPSGEAGSHRHRGPGRFDSSWSPIGPAEGAADDPALAQRAASAAVAPLLVGGRTVLLIDDAQWIDRDSMAVLDAMARRFAGSSLRCVCTVRTPLPRSTRTEGARVWAGLRADGLLQDLRLRPGGDTLAVDALRSATGATPAPEMLARVRRVARGIPAAVDDAIADMRRDGSIDVVGGYAYPVPGSRSATPPRHHLLQTIRRLGPDAWQVAKAMAVLSPLGPAVPELLASLLGTTIGRAAVLLDRLCEAGVLHRGLRGRTWRFTVPLVGSALLAHLGPYERRRLSETAVRAVWDGAATCSDPDLLTDLVAEAGRLVDPARARTELLARAPEAMRTDPAHAERWWLAVSELAEDREQRAHALFMHAVTCFVHGDYRRSMRGSLDLLHYHSDQLPPESVQEIQVMLVSAMHHVGDVEALAEVAAGRRFWHGDPAARTVTRAIALGLLDRWTDSRRLLSENREVWSGTAVSADLGELFEAVAELWAGRPQRFEHRLAGGGTWPPTSDERHRLTHVNAMVTALFCVGDLRGVDRMLAAEGLAEERLDLPNRAQLASARGQVEAALDLGRRCVAGGTARGYDAGGAPMQQAHAYLLIARGELSRARELLTTTRAQRPALVHLLDGPEAEIDKVLGHDRAATERLTATLDSATRRELVVGSDLTWALLADLALERGDAAAAVEALQGSERAAAALRTSRSHMYALVVRAAVTTDPAAARDAVAACRERGQPFELAVTISKLARHGLAEPGLLREAYDIFGDLDALLCRVWTRNLMLHQDVPVPGRQTTVGENERLLALLVTDGLTNKQLAHVLRTSDKSVEGRLSRLFTRTGYRSRIELAAAMASGEYDVRSA